MTSSDSPKSILVVEDDKTQSQTMCEALEANGFQCQSSLTGAEAVSMTQSSQFDIVLLDLALADDSGLGVLRCIRENDEQVGIILLTPGNFQQERIAGLEAGADDFIVTPCSMQELVIRAQASEARARAKPKSMLVAGPIQMDLTTRKVLRDGRNISLTPTEFRILEILLRHHSRVVTRRMLCEFLWNPEWEGVTNVIEVHINRLRTKLSAKQEPRLIHTVRGSGYTLRWDPAEVQSKPAVPQTVDPQAMDPQTMETRAAEMPSEAN